jgi:hypothetical protein
VGSFVACPRRCIKLLGSSGRPELGKDGGVLTATPGRPLQVLENPRNLIEAVDQALCDPLEIGGHVVALDLVGVALGPG